MTEARAHRVAENFRLHWTAKAGKDAVKVDWQACWMRWVREDVDRYGSGDGDRRAAGRRYSDPPNGRSHDPPAEHKRDRLKALCRGDETHGEQFEDHSTIEGQFQRRA